jgi:Bacterial Ig-like domain (group 2)
MRLLCRILLAASIAIAVAACHGNAPNPVAPAPQPVSVDSLAITSGVDTLRAGYFADYAATATMSDRTVQLVTGQAAWTTSDPAVAAVDANGRLTALNRGTITVTATYKGSSANRKIRIIQNYGGHWDGSYVARSCDQTGIFLTQHYCQNLGSSPSRLALDLTQSGPNLDEISGLISLRNLVGAVTGVVTTDDRLVLKGSYTAATDGFSLQVDIPTWLTDPNGNVAMTGWFVNTLSVVGAAGTSTQTNEITSAERKLETSTRKRF